MANEDEKGYSISDEQPSSAEHSDAHNKTLRSSQPAALNLSGMGVDKELPPLPESRTKPDLSETVQQPLAPESRSVETEYEAAKKDAPYKLSPFTRWLTSLKKPEVHVVEEPEQSEGTVTKTDDSVGSQQKIEAPEADKKPSQREEEEKEDNVAGQTIVDEPVHPAQQPKEELESTQPEPVQEDDSDSKEEPVTEPTAKVEQPADISDTGIKAQKSKKKKKKKKSGHKRTDDASSMVLSDDVFSQTLAELLEEQGHLAEAKTMYEKLRLKYPEKWRFFAAKIEELHKKA